MKPQSLLSNLILLIVKLVDEIARFANCGGSSDFLSEMVGASARVLHKYRALVCVEGTRRNSMQVKGDL